MARALYIKNVIDHPIGSEFQGQILTERKIEVQYIFGEPPLSANGGQEAVVLNEDALRQMADQADDNISLEQLLALAFALIVCKSPTLSSFSFAIDKKLTLDTNAPANNMLRISTGI